MTNTTTAGTVSYSNGTFSAEVRPTDAGFSVCVRVHCQANGHSEVYAVRSFKSLRGAVAFAKKAAA